MLYLMKKAILILAEIFNKLSIINIDNFLSMGNTCLLNEAKIDPNIRERGRKTIAVYFCCGKTILKDLVLQQNMLWNARAQMHYLSKMWSRIEQDQK